jgi:cytochrome c
MNIFEQFVIPPNPEHVGLLFVLQVISLLTFLPFAGIMLGASVFSIYFRRQATKTGNPIFTQISKDLMDKLTVGKAAGYALGILPLVSSVLGYGQLLYGAKSISASMMIVSLLLYIVSFLFIYNYKNSLHLASVFSSIKKSGELPEEAAKYENKSLYFGNRYGNWGVSLMFVSAFLFIGGTTIAAKPGLWNSVDNILKPLINPHIWVNFLFFVSASFAVTGSAILYFFFVWQGGIKDIPDEYYNIIRKLALRSALAGLVLLPLFIFINVLVLPVAGTSPAVYIAAGFALMFILITGNLLYSIYKNYESKYIGVVFFLMFFVFTFTVVKDQIVLLNALKGHLIGVTAKAEELAKEKESAIVQVSGADGEKIYNEKCIACHKFDQKVVGPPYQETVPKYNGDLKKLAGFIYNPQKINPAYPPMPSQGLKMKEAEAVAKYIMDKTSKK